MLSPSPPVPIFATFQTAGAILIVEFNKALQAGLTQRSQWQAWTGVQRRFNPLGAGDVLGRLVTMTLGLIDLDFQAEHVDFINAFDDVVGLNGLPVQTFLNFPLTII